MPIARDLLHRLAGTPSNTRQATASAGFYTAFVIGWGGYPAKTARDPENPYRHPATLGAVKVVLVRGQEATAVEFAAPHLPRLSRKAEPSPKIPYSRT